MSRSVWVYTRFVDETRSLTPPEQKVTIDGKPWRSNCFIEWDAFTNGSRIELQLTDDIDVSCGKGAGVLPPSLSTGGYD